jgi:zinc and cadmium transporter
MSPFAQSLLATFLVSAISLVGVLFLLTDWTERRALLFVSFAAGVLLATACLEMFPEAVLHHQDGGNFFAATLAAMAAFFVLERMVLGFHTHEDTHDGSRDAPHAPAGYFVLIGSTVHNFIDGVVIGASFLVSPTAGVATTLAVAAHEIPHEAADFAVLLRARFSRTAALLLNFLSGLAAMLGALWCFAFAGMVERHLSWFLAATAGMFIYIAASDLMPELHHSRTRHEWVFAVPFFIGVALIAVIAIALPDPR